MSTSQWRLTGGPGGVHPTILGRRASDLAAVALAGVIPAVVGLAVTIALPDVSLAAVLAAIAAVLLVVWLMRCTNVTLTATLLVLYLGLLDGPVKLAIGAHEVTASVRNVLILAVCLGVLMRIVVRRERVKMPPLAGWVAAFVGVVLIEVFNPKTEGVLKVFGGFRQQLQWVPFFFFAYYLVRSKKRLRQLFIVVGVIACANGAMSAYQTTLSPEQLAGWGPGYHNLIYIPSESKGTGRVYFSEGEARVRPPALGSEAGFSGGVGVIALPFALALFVTARRRRWIPVVLCLGAIIAIITGLGRTQLIGAFLSVIAFVGFAALARQRMTRAVLALGAVLLLAIPVGLVVTESLRSGTFKRYESIDLTSSSTDLHKESAWSRIPHYIEAAPFGFGLGSVGPVSGLEGRNPELLEGHSVSSETQFNLIVNELGAPGLLVWVALTFYTIGIIVRGMPGVRDGDLAIMFAGAFAPFIALLFESTTGPFTSSPAAGPYFWGAVGLAAYWFVGPGRKIARAEPVEQDARAVLA